MFNILVTGSAGFIGTNLCEKLLKNGHSVIGVDNYITGSSFNTVYLKKKYQKYSFYEYDYDYYAHAQAMLYNGIDDDEDGIVDEEDEILLMVTDEMTDGMDNNHNGLIDEYFEMTPKYFVNTTVIHRGSTTTTISENGMITTTGYWSTEWTEEKIPYTGQIIQFEICGYYQTNNL